MTGSPRTRGKLELRADRIDFTRRVYLPFQQFVQVEWVGSVLLLAAAVVALVWANSPWAEGYHHFWETHLTLDLGLLHLDESLHHWVNDGLMVLFFFLVGLEIKRELLYGNLSSPRKAALPVVAALGGMVVPAAIYAALNGGGAGASGWGIPMATDIAFALGVLGLVGRRVPSDLRVFLLALAVVDDLGAILVIAVFYTAEISLQALGAGLVVIGALFAMRRLGVRSFAAYGVVGVLLWVAVLESGIHATIAGVLLGALTPSRPVFEVDEFDEVARGLMDVHREAMARGDREEAAAALGKIEELTANTESPLDRLERKVHPWSSYVVLPVFALANSGVELTLGALQAALASPVTAGVFLGLLGGKVVGVVGSSWLAVKSGLAALPAGVSWIHVTGVSLLAGIGFTVALFITQLAFVDAALVAEGKMGILAASLVAGVAGYLFLRMTARPATD